MAKVIPALPRACMTENGAELCVVVPVRRDGFLLIFLSLWLAAWAFAEVMVAQWIFAGGEASPAVLLLVVWFVLWTVGGVWAILNGIWNAKGREQIRISGDTVSVRYEAFGIGKTRYFYPWAVKNLRVVEGFTPVAPFVMQMFSQSRQPSLKELTGIWSGPLSFDYGAKTYRFGAGMEEAEARQLLPHLLRRLSPDDPR